MELRGIKTIHFIGICGYIMSATAVMLKKMGYRVTGSDQDAYPPGTTTVNKANINWSKKYHPTNLDKPDLVVIGNHIRENNSEAQAALKSKLKVISLPELIAQIFSDKRRIVVAGTHGKTTTTSLIAWILESAGLNPSYLIGGIILNTDKGFKLGKGDFLVIEGDEYRTAFFDPQPKFFHYRPEIAVLTTCELDHPDYFD
jgi:UDP-N-acetylmuramate: L-alanyl-gamma-D-glutamyl-meso-diaminopimelate ligase